MNITLSPQDYATAYHLLSSTAQTAENIGGWLERHLLTRLPARASLLDVGAGPGTIARRIAPHFAALTLLEPNPNQLRSFDPPGARLLHLTLEAFDAEARFADEQYDVVLCSHMLYHVPFAAWGGFVDRLRARVRPGGHCVFTLMAAHGPSYDLHTDFTPTVLSTAPLKALLREKSLAYERYDLVNSFSSATFAEMYTLCRFFVLEDCFTAEQLSALSEEETRALDARIRAHTERCRGPDGVYRLRQDEELLLVTRP